MFKRLHFQNGGQSILFSHFLIITGFRPLTHQTRMSIVASKSLALTQQSWHLQLKNQTLHLLPSPLQWLLCFPAVGWNLQLPPKLTPTLFSLHLGHTAVFHGQWHSSPLIPDTSILASLILEWLWSGSHVPLKGTFHCCLSPWPYPQHTTLTLQYRIEAP